jgi:hypothetical protein
MMRKGVLEIQTPPLVSLSALERKDPTKLILLNGSGELTAIKSNARRSF